MLDFTSALYLGMHHPSSALRSWQELTTGVPAALFTPVRNTKVAQALAELMGCERGMLAPSTLHLFWDLFRILADDTTVLYMDAGSYPIVQWGVERAAAKGSAVQCFPHHEPEVLRHLLKRNARHRTRPIVVTDGWCPRCGKPAPIADYLMNVRKFGGLVIIDDTQALGILGRAPVIDAPYGKGGGGSLRWHNLKGPDILVVSSLAKGFGVPMAVLAGSDAMIRHFEAKSDTRVHCSPPSAAVVHAAEHALNLNCHSGDLLRQRLGQLVRRFRNRLAQVGFAARGGIFPVQMLASGHGIDTRILHKQLLTLGVRTVLLHARSGRGTELSFLINARHRPSDIDRAVGALAHAVGIKKTLKQHQWRETYERSF